MNSARYSEVVECHEEMNRLLPSSSQYNDAELKVMALNAACDEYFSCLPEGLSYSDIYRELEGNGNISANPETDYRLYLTEQWSGIDSYELLRQIASTEYAIFMLLKRVRDGKC